MMDNKFLQKRIEKAEKNKDWKELFLLLEIKQLRVKVKYLEYQLKRKT